MTVTVEMANDGITARWERDQYEVPSNGLYRRLELGPSGTWTLTQADGLTIVAVVAAGVDPIAALLRGDLKVETIPTTASHHVVQREGSIDRNS